jgi:predicted nucleotidyltransferase
MSTMPDLEPNDRRQLDDVVEFLSALLGDAMSAAYLCGSAVHGGLRADSDLDILLVLARPTTQIERRGLIDGLLARSRGPEQRDRRPLEVSVVVLPEIRPWQYPPPLELQYGDWWRSAFAAGELSPWISPNPDLAVLLASVREDGVPLVGPTAVELLDPVPGGDLERAVRDVIPVLLPGLEEDDTRNSLLTLARIWLTLATGRIESKHVAAAWALERLPVEVGEGLRLARAGYLGEARDTWDEPAMLNARTDWQAMLDAIDRI